MKKEDISVFRDISNNRGRVFAGLCKHIGFNFDGCVRDKSGGLVKVGSPVSGCPLGRNSCWSKEYEGDELQDLLGSMDEAKRELIEEVMRHMSSF